MIVPRTNNSSGATVNVKSSAHSMGGMPLNCCNQHAVNRSQSPSLHRNTDLTKNADDGRRDADRNEPSRQQDFPADGSPLQRLPRARMCGSSGCPPLSFAVRIVDTLGIHVKPHQSILDLSIF